MNASAVTFPRVLVISPNVLNPADGGGVLMGNLFAGWPRERIADIYSQWWIPENSAICARYYRLSRRISTKPSDWASRLVDYAGGRAESLDGIASFRLTRRLRDWIDAFSPQLIYSHLGPLWLTRLTNQVVRRSGAPLVVHINDDYISDWPVNGQQGRRVFPFSQILHALNYREFLDSLSLASARLAVSELMRQEYVKRYRLPFDVFTNGVDPAAWPEVDLPERVPTPAEPFTVLYTGSVAANTNLGSLEDCADVVTSLADGGMAIRLLITRPGDEKIAARLARPPLVELVDPVPHARMPARLADSDLLLLPFNFDEGSLRFIRYSWPTKMPEYMVSSRPILLYGPPDTAFGEYARRDRWAQVVDRKDRAALAQAIRDVVGDHGLRRTLVTRARALALREQDLHKTRARFQDLIRRVAS